MSRREDDSEPDLGEVARRIRARTSSDGYSRRRRRATSGDVEYDERTPEPELEPEGDVAARIDDETTAAPAQAPGPWQRHDLWVVLAALAVFAAGTLTYRSLGQPALARFERAGLGLDRPAGWLPRALEPPASPLAALIAGATAADPAPGYHVAFTSPADPVDRVELRIERRPTYNNLRGAMALDRVARYGEKLWVADTRDRSIDGRDWIRSRFRYAYVPATGGSPRVATAIEYAIVNANLVYVVTLHGSEHSAAELESLVAPSLDVDANALQSL